LISSKAVYRACASSLAFSTTTLVERHKLSALAIQPTLHGREQLEPATEHEDCTAQNDQVHHQAAGP
jgi:hypothetical protein